MSEILVDLSSDTVTQPSLGMRQAIASAVVGDEQRHLDPTVSELERRGAAAVGQNEAIFLPSATMANHIALKLLGRPGDEVIAEENSHLLIAESGGPAVHAGLITRGLPGRAGQFTPQQVRAAVHSGSSVHRPVTRIVAVENTHNSAGGRIWQLDDIAAVAQTARELGLSLHLDGSRLFNAAVATGLLAADFGRYFDTVTLCLSKGLGCPLGALLACSAELAPRARRLKHLFGGAMRQAGIVAAAGIYAFDHNISRLADDHTRARRLAQGLDSAGFPVDLPGVETNFVQLDVGVLGLTSHEALARLESKGIGLSATVHPNVLRAVTHLDVTDDNIELAIELIPSALRRRAPSLR